MISMRADVYYLGYRRDGHGLGPFMGWVGSHFPAHVNASNANAVYRQSTRYSCFTEESWVSIGLELGVQWVGVFTAT